MYQVMIQGTTSAKGVVLPSVTSVSPPVASNICPLVHSLDRKPHLPPLLTSASVTSIHAQYWSAWARPAVAVVHSIHDLQQHLLHLCFWQPGLALQAPSALKYRARMARACQASRVCTIVCGLAMHLPLRTISVLLSVEPGMVAAAGRGVGPSSCMEVILLHLQLCSQQASTACSLHPPKPRCTAQPVARLSSSASMQPPERPPGDASGVRSVSASKTQTQYRPTRRLTRSMRVPMAAYSMISSQPPPGSWMESSSLMMFWCFSLVSTRISSCTCPPTGQPIIALSAGT